VVADKKTGEFLGLHMFIANATDMIGEGLIALKLESTLKEMGDAIHPHPTVNEMVMEAVHDALGHCAHKIK
jgi:dihydrolipoamide dehydrogenase